MFSFICSFNTVVIQKSKYRLRAEAMLLFYSFNNILKTFNIFRESITIHFRILQ
jgi:hypothetical protein